jgi:hypothetical protein
VDAVHAILGIRARHLIGSLRLSIEQVHRLSAACAIQLAPETTDYFIGFFDDGDAPPGPPYFPSRSLPGFPDASIVRPKQ